MTFCEFDRLFSRTVPHILERIFFSLDYDSFMASRKVCKAWNELYSSELYQQKAKKLLEEKMYNEKKLWQYSFAGNDREVGNLLASGVNVNCVPEGTGMKANCEAYGKTPLHIAAMKGHKNVVKLLLDAGADPNREDNGKNNALYWPANDGDTAMVKLLLKGGANINKAGRYGLTPLHLAAGNDFTETAKALLDAGADLNAADWDGKTPLHIAECNGHNNVVDMLLNAGADPDLRNIKGQSSFDIMGNRSAIKLPLKHKKKRKKMN